MISQDVKTYVILDPPSKISSLSIVFKKMAEYNVKSDIYSHRYFYVPIFFCFMEIFIYFEFIKGLYSQEQ